jgi:hypothetical protein
MSGNGGSTEKTSHSAGSFYPFEPVLLLQRHARITGQSRNPLDYLQWAQDVVSFNHYWAALIHRPFVRLVIPLGGCGS